MQRKVSAAAMRTPRQAEEYITPNVSGPWRYPQNQPPLHRGSEGWATQLAPRFIQSTLSAASTGVPRTRDVRSAEQRTRVRRSPDDSPSPDEHTSEHRSKEPA